MKKWHSKCNRLYIYTLPTLRLPRNRSWVIYYLYYFVTYISSCKSEFRSWVIYFSSWLNQDIFSCTYKHHRHSNCLVTDRALFIICISSRLHQFIFPCVWFRLVHDWANSVRESFIWVCDWTNLYSRVNFWELNPPTLCLPKIDMNDTRVHTCGVYVCMCVCVYVCMCVSHILVQFADF